MNKYDNAKIYKITSSKTDKIYIGSTIQPLKERLSKHKTDYKGWLKGKYAKVTSYDIIQYDDCKIELIKNFPCESKKSLEREEGKYIRENNCVNKCVVGRTPKEYGKTYYEANKEKIKEADKAYREANREKITEKSKEYYEANRKKFTEKFNCECGGHYTIKHKARHFRTNKHQEYIQS